GFGRVGARLGVLERGGGARGGVASGGSLHRLSRRALKDDADDLPLELVAARQNGDSARTDGKLARLLERRALRVAEIVESIDELPIAQRLTAPELQRPCVDARQHGLTFTVQALVDQSREPDVVVAGDKKSNNERDGEGSRSPPHPSTTPDGCDADLQDGGTRTFFGQTNPQQAISCQLAATS